MKRIASRAITVSLGALLMLSIMGMPAQADAAMTVTLNHSKAYPGTAVVLTAVFDAATNADSGTVRVDVNGMTRSSTVADSTARITLPFLPIGSHDIVARFRAADQTDYSATAHTTVTIVSARRVTLGINGGKNASFDGGEKFWLRGQVRNSSNNPVPRQIVTLFSYVGTTRTTLATVTSSDNGTFSYAVRPSRTTQYRARRDSLVSPKITATRTTAARTLESRAYELAFMLGAAQTESIASGSVTYRTYARGTLVESGSRTWLVRGEILKEYLRRGGVQGKLGAPQSDERCRLMEGACLQRFAHGAVYSNAHAKDRATSAVAPGAYADLLATTLSQVGYTEPNPRQSKYNRWIHRTGTADAWCGYFLAWTSVASGHGSAVIKAKTFAGMVRAERERGHLTSKPAVGRLAYLDYFNNGKATHVGLVIKYSANYVWLVEGNVSAGGGSSQPRGVHIVQRKRSRVVFYANPRW